MLDNVTYYNYTNLTVNPDELAKLYSYVSTVAENPVGAEYKLFNNTLPLDIFPIELPKRTGHIFIVNDKFDLPSWAEGKVDQSYYAFTFFTNDAGFITFLKYFRNPPKQIQNIPPIAFPQEFYENIPTFTPVNP